MIPAFVLLHMYQGQTFNDEVVLRETNGDPLDLTGRTARMQVREYRGGPVVLTLTTENGGITLTALGEIKFYVSAAVLAEIVSQYDYEQWVYDLELVTPGVDPLVERPIYGTVVFWPEITTA